MQSVWLTAAKPPTQPQHRQGKLFTIPDKNPLGPQFSLYFTDEVVITGEASHLRRAEHLSSQGTLLLCLSQDTFWSRYWPETSWPRVAQAEVYELHKQKWLLLPFVKWEQRNYCFVTVALGPIWCDHRWQFYKILMEDLILLWRKKL